MYLGQTLRKLPLHTHNAIIYPLINDWTILKVPQINVRKLNVSILQMLSATSKVLSFYQQPLPLLCQNH